MMSLDPRSQMEGLQGPKAWPSKTVYVNLHSFPLKLGMHEAAPELCLCTVLTSWSRSRVFHHHLGAGAGSMVEDY